MNAPAPWPRDPDAVARAVLAQPEFHAAPRSSAAPPAPSPLDLLWHWFRDAVIDPLLRALHPLVDSLAASHAAVPLGWALIALSLAGFAFALARLVLALVAGASRANAGNDRGRALDARRTPAEWLAAAREAARAGDFRRAIAALFAAALARLDERDIVPFDPACTQGEYRRLVRARCGGAMAANFEVLAQRFVCAAYAREAAGRDDFEAAERALLAFEPSARAS